MKVFFTTTPDRNLAKYYQRIISLLKKQKIEVLLGSEVFAVNTTMTQREIFTKHKEMIDSADFMVAESTMPSTGTGGEIVYALMSKKPVLALVFKENIDNISPMLIGNQSDNLYLEHYDNDNLQLVVKDFVEFVKKQKTRKGKLIVIDGGDGSGKATQAKLLIEYLKKKKIPVKYMDFPRYYTSFHGDTVAKFLRGEFGSIDQVSPYLASLAYALDRAGAKEEMDNFLKKGGVIISNRYTTSNMGHQMSKFATKEEQKKYFKWLYDLEYKIHKIPKEDMVIYLHVPYKVADALTHKKEERKYLNGKKTDIHEDDNNYRAKVEKTFLELAECQPHWVKIDCTKGKSILDIDTIHKIVVKEVGKIV